MKNSTNTLLPLEMNELLVEIERLRQQLNYETQQHKHWESLAMIFHDALWNELRHSHKISGEE
jgi:hypothetical protein